MDDYLPQSYGSSMHHSHRNDAMMGFVMGAVLGAGLALLFAPAPGNETRRRLGDSAKRFGNDARHKFDELRHQARGAMNDVKDSVERGVHEAQSAMRETASQMGSATGPGQTGGTTGTQPPGSRSRI
jgi:gas vesicle protein